ncbi:HD-GYP domain-containing protein [Massilia sp. TS11]|uniref:HD-GYP domain-containing protein n=1 Tax=Massilia sp. TS11 TaxID=2908003 RepID=UPI001EDA1D2D|nr:HD domain-containing phosphohydrolase [Massilia sp. TS11]MCG2584562.1 HD domain-containing protein [Massilia sp. TS11]
MMHLAAAPQSVLHELNAACRELEQILLGLRGKAAADQSLRQLAQRVAAAVQRDPDVALASIFLNQIGGLYTVRHCVETAIVVVLMELALDSSAEEIDCATAAALTMNAGMLKEAEHFQAKPGMLSPAERAIVQRHPSAGANLLREAGVVDDDWLDYVLLHHEHEDGSGYPEGRSGDAIPRNAKLIGLADRYCAHVSARNYRRSLLPPAALSQLLGAGAAPVDAGLARLFRDRLGLYPPGTLVRLENGATGVVAHQAAPEDWRVFVLRPTPALHSSREMGFAIAAAVHEDEAGARFSMKQVWGETAAL